MATDETFRTQDFIVLRPRLFETLDTARGKVIVLCAPAGFGKTTLATQWVSGIRRGVWYRASKASSDVAALATGLSDALSAFTGADDRLLASSVGKDLSPTRLADLVLNSLPEWPTDSWLVIDDYHWLSGSRDSELLLDRLIAADRLNILAASRLRPSWVTARRLLYGEILELTQSALAMTTDEVEHVLQASQFGGELASTAQGWPAVVGLAARMSAATTTTDQASRLPEELHRFFAEELFQHLSDGTRTRLARLSIAPRIDGDLLTDIFGDSHGEFTAESVHAGFLTARGDEFELHPLLREFLAAKLPSITDSALVEFAKRLVANYLRRGYVDDAFAVGERIHSETLLMLTFDAGLEPLLNAGRLATIERWVRAARADGIASPIVELAEAEIELRTGKLHRAAARATRVAATVEPGSSHCARAWLLAAQSCHLDNRGDEAVGLLLRAVDASPTNRDRSRALWLTFFVQMELEDLVEAEGTLGVLSEAEDFEAEDRLRLEQARLLLAIRKGGIEGELDRAAAARDSMLNGVDPVVVTAFLHTLAHAHCLCARYEQAISAAEEVLARAERSGLDFVIPHALCELAGGKLGLRAYVEALGHVEEAFDRATAAGDVHSEMNSLSIAAKTYICQHEPARALSVLSGLWERPVTRGMSGEFYAVQALAFAQGGDTRGADLAIRRSEEASALSQGRGLRLFVRAILTSREDESSDSTHDQLQTALNAATQSGNVDAFVLAYRSHPQILSEMTGIPVVSPAAIRTLERVDPTLAAKFGLRPPRPRPREHKKLTNREVEILRLVSQGLSNRQIAATLWLSESTVKLHVHHVLEKLGAKSRTEAAAMLDA